VRNKFLIISIFNAGLGDYLCLTSLIKNIKLRSEYNQIVLITDLQDFYKHNPKISSILMIRNRFLKYFIRRINSFLHIFGLPFYNFQFKNKGIGLEDFAKNNRKVHYINLLSRHILKQDISFKNLNCELFFSNNELQLYSEVINFHKLPENFCLIHSQGKKTHTPNKSIPVQTFQNHIYSDPNHWVQIGPKSNKPLNNVINFLGCTEDIRFLCFLIAQSKHVVCEEGLYNHISSAFQIPTSLYLTGFSSPSFSCYSNTNIILKTPSPKCAPCYLLSPCPNNFICL